MLDFFQRRIETLEGELARERERTVSAQNVLAQQEGLRSEVESHLKSLNDQIRREKAEREGDESRSHARGRIEALEKRLDGMTATLSQVLTQAVSTRGDSPVGEALAAELAAFRSALKESLDGIARWRVDVRELSTLVPQVKGLTQRLPDNEKAFEESVGRRFDEFTGRMARTMEEWRRAHDAERLSLNERIETASRERSELARHWENQARAMRDEQAKDRVAREAEMARQISELATRLSELTNAQALVASGHDSALKGLDRVLSILSATPKAKDEVIKALEAEKYELVQIARDRQEALTRFINERRDVERSMGEALVKLTGELEEERARTRAADARTNEEFGEIEKMKARLTDLERSVSDRDERIRLLGVERDELVRALVAESDKVRLALTDRRTADAASEAALAEMQRRLDAEVQRRTAAESLTHDARAQMSALAEQTGRSLQERDATLARFSDWEKERQKLADVIRKKDEMISLLSATFQGALNKGT